MNKAKFVWANLTRNVVRTGLTMTCLVVAFLLFGLLQPINRVFTEGPSVGQVGRLIVTPKYSIADMLPVRYREQFAQLPGVEVAAHMTWFGGTYIDAANFFPQYAITPREYLDAMPELKLSPSARQAFLANRRGAIVGAATAARFGWQLGDRIPLIPTIWHNRDGIAWEFELVGIYQSDTSGAVSADAMYFDYGYFDEYRAFANGTVSNLLIKADHPDRLDTIAQAVDALTANSGSETKTMTDQEYALSFAKQMGNVGLIANAVLAAVFFTILMVTGNTFAQSARERISELAVMKVLGFRSTTVVGVLVFEVLVITIGSALLGMGLAQLLLSHLDNWLPQVSQLGALSVSPQILAIGLVLALVIGITVGTPPAIKMMRMQIVDALRV